MVLISMGVYYPDVYQKECIKYTNFQTSGGGAKRCTQYNAADTPSDLPQSKLLLGTRGDVQLPTHMSFSKKLQQPLSERSKHLIRLGCVVLQFELQAI